MTNKITREYLKDQTKEFDVETIFTLSLNGIGLFDLGSLGECVNLTILNLSSNRLSSVLALKTLSKLEYLDISSNRLSALTGLEDIRCLTNLDVSGNFLNSIDCLLPLTKIISLKYLRLKDKQKQLSNPIYTNDTFNGIDQDVIAMLPAVEVLNDEPLTGEGKKFNAVYTEMKLLNKGVEHLQTDMDCSSWRRSLYEEDYVRVGSEKNEVYNKANEMFMECEENSKKAHAVLQTMLDLVS